MAFARELLGSGSRDAAPTALLCGSDIVAYGVHVPERKVFDVRLVERATAGPAPR